MAIPPESFSFDDPRWLGMLFRGVLAEPSRLPVPRRRSDLDRELHDWLWSSGALMGSGPRPAGVVTQTPAESAFVQLVHAELSHAAATLRSTPIAAHPDRLRWMLAATLASFTGEAGVAAIFDEASRGEEGLSAEEEARLFEVVGAQLRRRAYLLGNPPDGLPLHAGLASIEGRTFVRLAAAHALNGGLLRPRADAYLQRMSRLKAKYIELLAGIFALADAAAPRDAVPWRRGAGRQVRALPLPADDRRAAAAGIRQPRAARDLFRHGAPSVTQLLVEQAILAALVGERWAAAREPFLNTLGEAGVDRQMAVSAEARAAAFLIEHPDTSLRQSGPESALETAMHRTLDSLQEASEAIAEEIRETGELGVLLARMARGETMTLEERRKIRAQLIDLAKVVPSLAIFAAPGGMLLLPILVKVLPFDLLPSAFHHRKDTTATPPRQAG